MHKISLTLYKGTFWYMERPCYHVQELHKVLKIIRFWPTLYSYDINKLRS